MGEKKIEKIFRIMPIQKIWTYIKEHRNLSKQEKNKNRNSKNTISFEETKKRILERDLKDKNESTQKRRYSLTSEELYRMERARVRRSKRLNQLNQERNNVKYATQITSIEEKRRMIDQNKEEEATINTRTRQSNRAQILKYNRDFYKMQEAYHKTSSRRPTNESVIDYENRKSQITNTKKSTIIDFKQRYAVGSNECYQYLVNRKNDTRVTNRPKGWER